MEFSWTILLLLIFILSLLFSFTIEENTLKICYWLVIFLFALTIFNIILSVQYYIQLRNDPGIKGPRGPAGRKGPIGLPGVCAIDDDCGKESCRKKIKEAVQEAFPEIENSCLENVEECMSDDQRILVKVIQKEIDKLEANCKASEDPVSVFVNKIRPQITELGGNGKASAD
jgi:hypothetical protein